MLELTWKELKSQLEMESSEFEYKHKVKHLKFISNYLEELKKELRVDNDENIIQNCCYLIGELKSRKYLKKEIDTCMPVLFNLIKNHYQHHCLYFVLDTIQYFPNPETTKVIIRYILDHDRLASEIGFEIIEEHEGRNVADYLKISISMIDHVDWMY